MDPGLCVIFDVLLGIHCIIHDSPTDIGKVERYHRPDLVVVQQVCYTFVLHLADDDEIVIYREPTQEERQGDLGAKNGLWEVEEALRERVEGHEQYVWDGYDPAIPRETEQTGEREHREGGCQQEALERGDRAARNGPQAASEDLAVVFAVDHVVPAAYSRARQHTSQEQDQVLSDDV